MMTCTVQAVEPFMLDIPVFWRKQLKQEFIYSSRCYTVKRRAPVYHQYVSIETQKQRQNHRSSSYLLSRFDLLGPVALRPFLVDLSLLPGFPHKLLPGAVNHVRSLVLMLTHEHHRLLSWQWCSLSNNLHLLWKPQWKTLACLKTSSNENCALTCSCGTLWPQRTQNVN